MSHGKHSFRKQNFSKTHTPTKSHATPLNLIRQDDVRKVKEQVLEWMSVYNAPIAERRWGKQLEDLEKIVTPKDI